MDHAALPPSQTRPSLLVRVGRADEAAWRQFEAAYSGLVIRYCRRRGLQLSDAEDVCQVVMAKLSRSLSSFEYDRSRGRFRDYLGRCTRNAVVSFLEGHSRRPSTVSLGETDPTGPEADRDDVSWQEEWTKHHYRRAMQSLRSTVDDRSLAIFDAILQGRDPAAIEAAFSTNAVAIRKVKQRMRDRLQAVIARQIEDEELSVTQSESRAAGH